VLPYQLFPRRRRPRLLRARPRARRRRRLPSLRIRGGPLRHRFDLPRASGATKQIQPERLILACHPGNALKEPWHLAVHDRVLAHNLPNVAGCGRVPNRFLSARAAPLEAGAVVTLCATLVLDCSLRSRGALRSSLLRSPAGAYRRSQRIFSHARVGGLKLSPWRPTLPSGGRLQPWRSASPRPRRRWPRSVGTSGPPRHGQAA
jgi:hypothetical protein